MASAPPASWAELHEVAQAHGLRAQLRGNGLVFVAEAGAAVKGSSIARDLSKAALERRLGPFQSSATATGAVRVRYQRRPIQLGSAALYERYIRDREAANDRRSRAIARLGEERGGEGARLQQSSQRRWAAVRHVARGRIAWTLWSAYARQADRRERERARQRRRRAVRAVAAELRRPSWIDWLRDRAAHGDSGGACDPALARPPPCAGTECTPRCRRSTIRCLTSPRGQRDSWRNCNLPSRGLAASAMMECGCT